MKRRLVKLVVNFLFYFRTDEAEVGRRGGPGRGLGSGSGSGFAVGGWVAAEVGGRGLGAGRGGAGGGAGRGDGRSAPCLSGRLSPPPPGFRVMVPSATSSPTRPI